MEINTRVPQVFPRDSWHAIVFSERSMDFNTASFSETVSLNSGINIRMFLEEEKALEWLDNPY